MSADVTSATSAKSFDRNSADCAASRGVDRPWANFSLRPPRGRETTHGKDVHQSLHQLFDQNGWEIGKESRFVSPAPY
jgi:hypothetical protein